uniref:Uncharacterized protein n=1 Tax=Burkholderia sp. M701 TaxID=326454 RepID=V5YNC5_9BURK|nr:hypothetical protein [Burkholderia sp. M701]BAO18818.1 hypothetical protein [Burkholderia sp. M701]
MNSEIRMIAPFENESEVVKVDGLTVENRTDRVSIYGSVDLTLDRAGLLAARALKANVDAIVDSMEQRKDLPERIQLAPGKTVDNPFGSESN